MFIYMVCKLKLRMSKKATSSIVATSLIIVIVVISTLTFKNWTLNYQNNILTDIEQKIQSKDTIKLQGLIKENMYIYSSGKQILNSFKIKDINGTEMCNIEIDKINNLSLHFRFEQINGNQVIDLSSKKNNGTMLNGVNCKAKSIFGNGCLFDGINDSIEISNVDFNQDLNSKNSILFWMKWDSSKNYAVPVITFPAYDLTFFDTAFGFNTGQSETTGIPFDKLKDKWTYIGAIFNNGVVNGTNNELYINGIKETNLVLTGSNPVDRTISSQLYISINPHYYYAYKGLIDEFRVYKRALKKDEMLNIYSSYMQKGINVFDVSSCNLENDKMYDIVVITENGLSSAKVIKK